MSTAGYSSAAKLYSYMSANSELLVVFALLSNHATDVLVLDVDMGSGCARHLVLKMSEYGTQCQDTDYLVIHRTTM